MMKKLKIEFLNNSLGKDKFGDWIQLNNWLSEHEFPTIENMFDTTYEISEELYAEFKLRFL